VRTFVFPPAQLPGERRAMHEHSYYLDQLIQIAVEDGATHIATLHLDSFPIRIGWIEELASRLADTCVIATVEGINTACLTFGAEFYRRFRPSMLVSRSVQATLGFRNYIQTFKPIQHSGIGYGFTACANGLSWYYLSLTASCRDYGCIYDDMIFHLGGAVGLRANTTPGAETTPSLLSRGVLSAAAAGRVLLPAEVRGLLRARFARWCDRLIDRPRTAVDRRRHDVVARELLQAPDTFLEQLRRRSRVARRHARDSRGVERLPAGRGGGPGGHRGPA
jgi:hypothetical protein